ncbi:MAG: hypothetical protein M3167_19820, partial [Acidobacteriota bacterium]|nr:hypothetical protein [Acidobacteriota bacterium]
MTECLRRLDPIDCEALASGEPPMVAADARSHAASCPACAEKVRAAADFLREIEAGDMALPGPGPDLATRVVRIRPFSRRERRDLRLWAGPAALSAGVFAVGVGILAAPGLSAGDQAG